MSYKSEIGIYLSFTGLKMIIYTCIYIVFCF
jgi:hypothetical protein